MCVKDWVEGVVYKCVRRDATWLPVDDVKLLPHERLVQRKTCAQLLVENRTKLLETRIEVEETGEGEDGGEGVSA